MDRASEVLSGRRAVAGLLERRHGHLLPVFRRRLAEHGGDPRGADAVHAERVLRDTVARLRDEASGGWGRAAPSSGAQRVRPVHPADLERPAAVLAEVVLTDLRAELHGSPEAADLIAAAAVELNRSTLAEVHAAADRYVTAVLNDVREAQTGERARIAHELHDRLGHSLSAAYRNVEVFELARERGVDRPDKFEVIRMALRDALEYLRAFACDLQLTRPLGPLREALAHLPAALGVDGTRIVTEVNGDEGWAPPDMLDEVYLVVREAMRNAVAHACATVVTARIDIAPQHLRATVSDDGIGFDPAACSDGGTGLRAMTARAAALNGQLSVARAGASGTTLELVVPLAARAVATSGAAR